MINKVMTSASINFIEKIELVTHESTYHIPVNA